MRRHDATIVPQRRAAPHQVDPPEHIVLLAGARTLLVHDLRAGLRRTTALQLPAGQAWSLLTHELIARGLGVRHGGKGISVMVGRLRALRRRLYGGALRAPLHAPPTQTQRVRAVVARLFFYDGYGAGATRVTHVGVSVVGIVRRGV